MQRRQPTERTAVVFGGSGFVGRYVVQRMARRGWRVRVPTRDPERATFLRTMGAVGQVAPIFGNIRDEATTRAAVEGADYIVNLVGIMYERGRNTFGAAQYEGAKRLAKICLDMESPRFIQISAIGADLKSQAHYARSKAGAERAARDHYQETTILRPSVVFGPEDEFFNRFAQMARVSPVMPLIGGGQTRFQPVYVGDVADAIMACLDQPETVGETYELGGPRVYTFRQLLELMLEECHRKRRFMTIPWGLAKLQGTFLEWLPKPPLTVDQVEMLKRDNVVSGKEKTLSDLGIEATALEMILPSYMDVYRPGGRFADKRDQPA